MKMENFVNPPNLFASNTNLWRWDPPTRSWIPEVVRSVHRLFLIYILVFPFFLQWNFGIRKNELIKQKSENLGHFHDGVVCPQPIDFTALVLFRLFWWCVVAFDSLDGSDSVDTNLFKTKAKSSHAIVSAVYCSSNNNGEKLGFF